MKQEQGWAGLAGREDKQEELRKRRSNERTRGGGLRGQQPSLSASHGVRYTEVRKEKAQRQKIVGII